MQPAARSWTALRAYSAWLPRCQSPWRRHRGIACRASAPPAAPWKRRRLKRLHARRRSALERLAALELLGGLHQRRANAGLPGRVAGVVDDAVARAGPRARELVSADERAHHVIAPLHDHA